MMTVEFLRDVDETAWSDRVAGLGGNALHLPEVVGVDGGGRRPIFVMVRNDGDVVGVATGRRRKGGLKALFRPPELYFPTVPACGSVPPDRKLEIIRAVIDAARENGFSKVLLAHTWGLDFRADRFFGPHVVSDIVEFVLDLAPGRAYLLTRMHPKHRKNIRKAEALGVRIVSDVSLQGLATLRAMQLSSRSRLSRRGGWYRVADKRYFRRLHRSIYARGIGDVLLALHEGRCVAALAYLRSGRRAITVRAGAVEEGYRVSATYALMMSLIDKLEGQGYTEVNIGGVPLAARAEDHLEHGLYQFKAGFGGTGFTRNTIEVPL